MNSNEITDKKLIVWDNPNKPPIDKLVLLWNGHNVEKNQISILNELEKNSGQLRSDYLKIIFELGKIKILGKEITEHLKVDAGFSLWWMTLVAEKSIERTKVPFDSLRLLALNKFLLKNKPSSIELFTKSKKLSNAIKKLCVFHNIKYKKNYEKSRIKSYTINKVWRILPYLIRVPIFLIIYSFKKWPLRRSLRKNWIGGDNSIFFFSYFVHLDKKSLKNGKFYSFQWQKLPLLLRKKGIKTNWIHHFIPNPLTPNSTSASKTLNKIYDSSNKLEAHNFLESFLTIKILINSIFNWFIFYIKFLFVNIIMQKTINKEKYNYLWSFIEQDWKNSTSGINAIENILYVNMIKNFISKIPKMKIGLYLCENQSWEKAFIYYWKKFGHGKIIGVPHSSIRYWDLRYFNHPEVFEKRGEFNLPLPDQFAINSQFAWKAIKNASQPMQKMVRVEPLRFLHLEDIKRNKSDNNILILSDLDSQTSDTMLTLLNYSSDLLHSFRLTLKPHPANSIDVKKYSKLNLSLTDKPLSDLLPNYSLVISSIYTTASLEAYLIGIPIITILDNNFNTSPLRDVKNVNFISTFSDLETALINFKLTHMNKKDNFFFSTDKDLQLWQKLLNV
jgi:surface carbohydrate biosynthesis protein (TIGR04326 family)